MLVRLGRPVLLDQRVRELPLGAGERDPVSLQRADGRAPRAKLLPLEGQRRDPLLERLHAEAAPLAPEATRCNGPQSRSAHPYRTIGKNAQMSSPQTGHFPQRRKTVGYHRAPMGVQVSVVSPGAVEADVLAVPVVEPAELPRDGALDEPLRSRLEALASAGEVSHLDGISVDAADWHMNVRPSNTEPLLRLNLEARSRELMERKRDEVLDVIRS